MSSYRAALAFALCTLALSSACQTTPHVAGIDNQGLVTGRLAAVNPLDVVVLQPENLTGRNDLPLDAIRREFQSGLVKLRYSPLALDYVDHAAVEASYRPGALGEQAVFQVFITGWDDSLWRSHARLIVDADVYLLDPAAPERESALWGGHVTRRVDLAGQRTVTTNMNELLTRAVGEFSKGVLASLPARNPEHTANPQ